MTPSDRLKGKRAVITGAASGIGRAAAEMFAREGAAVGLIDIDETGLEETAATIAREGGDALQLVADVTQEDQVREAVGEAEDAWGGLDIVVANAGIAMVGQDDRADRLSLEVWQHMIDVNLTGIFLTCKHGIGALLDSGGGAVVCTTSPAGIYGIAPDQSAYSASKAGVYGLTRAMAAAYGRENIRVNGVMPGYTQTALTADWVTEEHVEKFKEMVPLPRPGKPEDIAAVMLFLASDDAANVTGAIWASDAGWTAV
ncbi:MAG: SDR family NAD(P)-dependent oxidoreductase [Gammaproteobacteria bacterium]|jgi:NAD(P)-dependent dehydrogenase (short-subunit alcohol dehydrogenase family)